MTLINQTINILILSFMFCLIQTTSAAETSPDERFPLRQQYGSVVTISLQKFSQVFDDVIIVDVRSQLEFQTLHILNATNIPIANMGFMPKLRVLRKNDQRPIIFYCNGTTCKKSYEANIIANKNGINNVLTFDLGVLGWVQEFPEKSVLLKQSPVDLNKLISQEKFNQHLLSPNDFIKKISADSLVFDVRDRFQRDVTILDEVTLSLPLDNFQNMLKLIEKKDTPIFIYDAVGKQIRWLQYFLEAEGIKKYYFLDGGIRQYLKMKPSRNTMMSK